MWVPSWVEKIAWSREWQPPPVFLPGKFHGQKSLAGYSPWGCRVRHDRSCTHTLPFTLREMNPSGYLREGVPGRGTGGTKGAERTAR